MTLWGDDTFLFVCLVGEMWERLSRALTVGGATASLECKTFVFLFLFFSTQLVCDLNCYKLPPYKWQKMCLVHSTPGLSFKVQLIYSIKVTVAMSSQGNSFRL